MFLRECIFKASTSVGITICKWLFQAFHDVQAVSTFDYILPLMPELFRFGEMNDNEELANRAQLVLVRMCGVTPPAALVNPLIDGMFIAIRNASVSVGCDIVFAAADNAAVMESADEGFTVTARSACLVSAAMSCQASLLVFYFRQFTMISDEKVSEILEVRFGVFCPSDPD